MLNKQVTKMYVINTGLESGTPHERNSPNEIFYQPFLSWRFRLAFVPCEGWQVLSARDPPMLVARKRVSIAA